MRIPPLLITFKLGHLCLKTSRIKKAEEMFEQVIGLDPHFFEAYEMLVNIAIDSKNWRNLIKILKVLKIRVRSLPLREDLEKLTFSIESALNA